MWLLHYSTIWQWNSKKKVDENCLTLCHMFKRVSNKFSSSKIVKLFKCLCLLFLLYQILYDRENNNYRTPKVNSVIRLITSIARSLEEGIKRKAALLGGLSNVVTPIGFEPMAHSLEGCCSIQLSYGTRLLVLPNNLECEFTTFF